MSRPYLASRFGALLLSATLASCMAIGEPVGLEMSGQITSPPRADGPIPASFTAFVESLWPDAQARGISRATFRAAFDGIGPDPTVIEAANRQAEFVKPIWDYLDGAASAKRIANGTAALAQHRATLDRIEATYGVPREIVVAIWGMESSYGEVLGNPKVVRNVVRALATLAWDGGRRASYGRTQLLAVLKILERGDIDAIHITGSWAGAMGHTQFIPTTYEAYAVDFTSDGRRDIWTTIPDALASTANYLKRAGWRSGEPWGVEVVLPAGLGGVEDGKRRSVADWRARGVRRAGGGDLPAGGEARLWLPAGSNGPAFLTMHNFTVIKRYNNANAYALGVGHLADRLAGGGPIRGEWPRPYRPLDDAGRMELQTLLSQRGFDVGKIDGTIGSQSRAAILAYQAANGLEQNGYPSVDLLAHMRR